MTAPNFKGNYPLGGERIGPLWREMWEALADGAWRSGGTLAGTCAPRHGLDAKTARGILRQAAKAGVLEQEYRARAGSKRAGPGTSEAWFRLAK